MSIFFAFKSLNAKFNLCFIGNTYTYFCEHPDRKIRKKFAAKENITVPPRAEHLNGKNQYEKKRKMP